MADHDRRQRHRPTPPGRDRLPAGRQLEGVQAHPPRPRRAAAGRCAAAWTAATPPVVAYMDVDLSTDLDALLPLVAPLVSGHSDVAIGTRLLPALERGPGPQARGDLAGYNLMLRAAFCAPASPMPSAASRRCAPTWPADAAAAGRGRGLVLRHRAAGAGRAQRAAHPRGARRLGGRPRLPGRRRPPPPSRTCGGWCAWPAPSPPVAG